MAADPFTTRTVDDLMLEDANLDIDDDPFADKPPRNPERDDKSILSPRKRKAEDENPFEGDMDEEIKITKQRKKIPKLDAERLLSEPGIPKMRKLLRSGNLKKKLRFKGKGHEFSDAAKLLNYYQMWLDQLYPRAKFADALQLVEKAGHTKKLQMYRKSWIDEGKPGFVRRQDVEQAVDMQDTAQQYESFNPAEKLSNNTSQKEAEEDPTAMFFAGGNDDDEPSAGGPDDDELDALLAQDGGVSSKPNSKPNGKGVADVDSEGEDDLDALLAQETSNRRHTAPTMEDQDELDALMTEHHAAEYKPRQVSEIPTQDDEEEDDELDAILNEDSQTKAPEKTSEAPSNDLDTFDGDDDDLDALFSHQPTAAASEPELPATRIGTSAPAPETLSLENALPGSGDVPELDSTAVSSSPIPNVRTDELDDLMDEHDATVEKQKVPDSEIVGEFLSSSPIPNRDSQ